MPGEGRGNSAPGAESGASQSADRDVESVSATSEAITEASGSAGRVVYMPDNTTPRPTSEK